MIVVDVEATGLDHAKCSLLSIGAVYFEDPSIQFYQECRANEGALVVDKALEIAGFSKKEIADSAKQTQTQLIKNFLDWCQPFKNKTFAGKNVHFDYYWIEREIMQNLPEYILKPALVELTTVVFMKLVENGIDIPTREDGFYNLGFKHMLNFVGLNDVVVTHNALEDAILETECLSRLVYGKSIIEKFTQLAIPKILMKSFSK